MSTQFLHARCNADLLCSVVMPARLLVVWMLLVQPCNKLGKAVPIPGNRSLVRGICLQLVIDRLSLALALLFRSVSNAVKPASSAMLCSCTCASKLPACVTQFLSKPKFAGATAVLIAGYAHLWEAPLVLKLKECKASRYWHCCLRLGAPAVETLTAELSSSAQA